MPAEKKTREGKGREGKGREGEKKKSLHYSAIITAWYQSSCVSELVFSL